MYPKILVFILLILLLVSLASCEASQPTLPAETKPPPTGAPTLQPSTPTPIPSPTRTEPPTKTPYPTRTPEPTPTLVPTATPPEPLNLADNIQPVAVVDHFMGFWSPNSHTLIGSFWNGSEPPAGALSSAPGFELEFIEMQGEPFIADPAFYHWNPNGQNVLAGWIPLDLYESSWPFTSLPVTVNSDGNQMDSVLKEQYAYSVMNFYGWMTPQIIAISDYSGGGHQNFQIIDIKKKTMLASVLVFGDGYQANQHYIPVVQNQDFDGYRVMAVTRFRQPDQVEVDFETTWNARIFPDQAVEAEANTFFKDWMPDSNQMLVQAAGRSGDLDDPGWSELVLWDVDTDEVWKFIPGGLDGKFSPDGKSLAFVTYGPIALRENDRLDRSAPVEVDPEQKLTLHWMTYEDQIVHLSLPIFLEYEAVFRFSNDSRYLGLLTPGKPQLDENGWPTGQIEEGDESPTLVVLDLIDRRMVYSAPAYHRAEFEFSPLATHLVYRDDGEEWVLLNLESGQATPVTVTGGSRLVKPAWSYDGQYYLLEEEEEFDLRQANSWVFETPK